MNETLQPSTLGEILDRTAQLYRSNFWLFVGTAALPMVCAILLAIPAIGIFAIPGIAGIAGSSANTVSAIQIAGFSIAFLIVLPVYLGVYVFAIAGITQATVAVHGGEKLTIRAALKSVWPRFWTYLWYLILQGIVALILPSMVGGALISPPIYLITRPGTGIAESLMLGFAIFVLGAAWLVVGIWLLLSYAMGMSVCVVEKKTAWQSLRRAAQLSKGTRGRIVVLFLLLIALSMVVSMIGYIFAAIGGVVAGVTGGDTTAAIVATAVGMILYGAVSIGGQIVLLPVSWIALVLFYYDQRIRKEGFDIEWMMQRAGMTQLPTATSTSGSGFISGPVTPPDTVEER